MSARADNRAAFPFAAGVMDDLRAVFGDGVKLMYAEENGREVGKPGAAGVPLTRVPRSVSEMDSMNIKTKGKA